MSPPDAGGSRMPVSALLFVAALLGGIALLPEPLRPDRPRVSPFVRDGLWRERIEARLWQDPFLAVREHRERARATGEEGRAGDRLEDLRSDLLVHTLEASHVTLLPVLVPGSHYAVDEESRRRERHAVLSALGRKGYVPETDDRLGVVMTEWATRDLVAASELALVDEGGSVLPVAYEWFVRPGGAEDPRPAHALVLWLDETAFEGRLLLAAVDALLTRLVATTGLSKALRDGTISVRALGPSTSTGLLAILGALRASPAEPPVAAAAWTASEDDERGRRLTDPAPEGAELDALARRLVAQADAYLDDGLPSDADVGALAGDLAAALARPEGPLPVPRVRAFVIRLLVQEDDLQAVLAERLADVEDSDPAWPRSVVELWLLDVVGELLGGEPSPDDLSLRSHLDAALRMRLDELGWDEGRLATVVQRLARLARQDGPGRSLAAWRASTVPRLQDELQFLITHGRDPLEDVRPLSGLARDVVTELQWLVVLRALRSPEVLDAALWREALGLFETFLRSDPELGVPPEVDLGPVLAELVARWPGPPEDADPRAGADWLLGTVPGRRAFLLAHPALAAADNRSDGPVTLQDQLMFELARWDSALATYAWPQSSHAAALNLLLPLERNLLHGIPRDAEVDRLLRETAALIELSYEHEGLCPLPDGTSVPVLTAVRDTARAHVRPGPEEEGTLWLSQTIEDWAEISLDATLQPAGRGAPGPRQVAGTREYRERVVVDSVLPWTSLYSSHATASERALLVRAGLADEAELGAAVARRLGGAGEERFVSTVASDDVLLRGVVDELGRRGVDFADGRGHVALVCEWNTFYGRRMPSELRGAVAGWLAGRGSAPDEAGALAGALVHPFSYLRGLDGAVPGRADAQPRPSAGGRDASERRGSRGGELERPDGPSQLDYVRRLTDRLLALDRRLRRDGDRVVAVGVLGSDVYDKQLVLQALHERMPEALFFTTDLDTRLFHAERRDWSSNLVVASSYGLALDEAYQGSIPPFRDAYQTATFVACQLALGGLERDAREGPGAGPVGAEDVRRDLRRPRVFELGRSGAWDLSVDAAGGRGAAAAGLHPARPSDRPSARTLAHLGVSVVLLVALLLPFHRRLRLYLAHRDRLDAFERRSLGRLSASFCLLVALLAVALYTDGADGEPFALFEGISVWPTQLARILAITLSAQFLLLSWYQNVRDLRALSAAFGVDDPELDLGTGPLPGPRRAAAWLRDLAARPRSTLARLGAWRREVGIEGWRASASGEKLAADALWREYLHRERVEARIARVLPPAALFVVFALVVLRLGGLPGSPARGWVARGADALFGGATALALVLLVFFVADATRLFARLVRLLADNDIDWPPRVRWRLLAERGLEPEDADDYFDVEAIARRSEFVGRLILYPFVILLIVILSRNAYFDRWGWSPPLVLVMLVLFTYALVPAVLLRRAAEHARREAVGRLRARLSRAVGEVDPQTKGRAERLRIAIDEVTGTRRAIFSSYYESPIAQAVLIPFGGVGLAALLEMAVTFAG